MDTLFTHTNKKEGKIGIGRVPISPYVLKEISDEYYKLIPDKNASTYHTWYENMPPSIKQKVNEIQKSNFWDKLCTGDKKCIKINAREMDELYYSNPKNNLDKINLYGATGNYDIHKDCIFNFNGIRFYRIIIGLTDGNDNIVTYFNNLGVGHKLNLGDYIIFDFDRTTHQVIKLEEKPTPRIILKIHYLVCDNCNYSKEYLEFVKKMYLYYEFLTRYFMQIGTDPETFYQFFWGLFCQFYMNKNTKFILAFLIIVLFKFLSLSQVSISLFLIYMAIVTFYWLRYKLTGFK